MIEYVPSALTRPLIESDPSNVTTVSEKSEIRLSVSVPVTVTRFSNFDTVAEQALSYVNLNTVTPLAISYSPSTVVFSPP